MKKLTLIILLLVTAVSCAEPTCFELTEEYRTNIDTITEEWDDALQIANSTARMSLSGPLGELQQINRDTKRIEPPECATKAQDALVNYQEYTIDAFIAFLGQDEDEVVSDLFDEASDHLQDWAEAYAEISTDTTE